jgi:hypothetical protein
MEQNLNHTLKTVLCNFPKKEKASALIHGNKAALPVLILKNH